MESSRIRFVLWLIALSLGHVSEAADTTSIFFRHYSGGSHRDIKVRQVTQLIPQLNLKELTVFYIHGILTNVDSDSVKTIVNAYLKNTTHNIIAIDYREFAGIFYPYDWYYVDDVGKAIGNALKEMVTHGLNCSNVHVIGHSLGAQLSNHAAAYTNCSLARITGLDPAAPGFRLPGTALRSGKAQFVDIIHTDAGLVGLGYRIGDVDFFPNNGRFPQEGCRFNPFDPSTYGCDHSRSWMYYAESVYKPQNFLGVQCVDAAAFKHNRCNLSNIVPMGYKTPTSARGSYYLRTNPQSPFGKGLKGI